MKSLMAAGNQAKGLVSVLVVVPDHMEREKISGIISRHEDVLCVIQASSCDNFRGIMSCITPGLAPEIAFVDIQCLTNFRKSESCPLESARMKVVFLVDDGELDIPEVSDRFCSSCCVEKSRISDRIDDILDAYYSAAGSGCGGGSNVQDADRGRRC